MGYSHSATITREVESSGARDDYGQPTTAATDTSIYSGAVDVQDLSYSVVRGDPGDAALSGDARMFFPGNAFPAAVLNDDKVSATFEGVTYAGRVVFIDRLEESVVTRWQ